MCSVKLAPSMIIVPDPLHIEQRFETLGRFSTRAVNKVAAVDQW